MDKSFLLVLMAFTMSFRVISQSHDKSRAYDKNKKFTIAELSFDLAILKDALIKTHPSLYRYQTEEEFENNYSKLQRELSRPMTEIEFLTYITPFIASIKCGHTEIDFSRDFNDLAINEFRTLPLGFRIIENKIYLLENYSPDTAIAIGSEIIAINGIRTDSILRFMRPYQWLGRDGYWRPYPKLDELMMRIYGLFDDVDWYDLKVRTLNGDSISLKVEALELKTIETNYTARYEAPNEASHSAFGFQIIDSVNTGLLRLDAFWGKHFRSTLRKTFKKLKKQGTKHLIIDLRGNTGGMDDYARELYSCIAKENFKFFASTKVTIDNLHDSIFKYGEMDKRFWRLKSFLRLKFYCEAEDGMYRMKNITDRGLRRKPMKPHKYHFTGNVVVLIDEKSFSATTEFCATASYYKRAVFVGRETGGGYCGNTSGEDLELILPNTKIEIDIPLIKYEMAVEGPCGGGIKPDYPVILNVRDLLLNRDTDLLFALDLLKR